MSLPPTYVFDGECVLCSRAVQYVLAHDTGDPPVRFVAITSKGGRKLAHEHGVDPDDPHTFIFVEDGTGYLSSDAVFALSKHVGRPGRWIGIFKIVPRPIRDWFYRRIANNRYTWFGKLDHCYRPTPETRERFVLE